MNGEVLEYASRLEYELHELDELADLVARIPELAMLSAEDFDRAAYELQMIEFEDGSNT